MGKDKRRPLVEMETPNGKPRLYWESGQDAAKFYGFNPVVLSQHLHGKVKHASKRYFRFATPEEIEAYKTINQKITDVKNEESETAAPNVEIPAPPIEIISQTVEKTGTDSRKLTPFDILIKKGKEKLK